MQTGFQIQQQTGSGWREDGGVQEDGSWIYRDMRIPCSLLCYSSFEQVLSRETPFSEVGMHFQPGKLFPKAWEAGLGWGGFRSGKVLP